MFDSLTLVLRNRDWVYSVHAFLGFLARLSTPPGLCLELETRLLGHTNCHKNRKVELAG